MRPSIEAHDALAQLLQYPRGAFQACLDQAAGAVAEASEEASAQLAGFVGWAREQSLDELEEAFTRTFDNTEARALEVGWHAFGESYTRGTFMVDMRRRLREHGIEESSELPDHLSHVLALLGRCEEGSAADLAAETVRPAVAKIHDALVGGANPWVGVLAAVLTVLAMHEKGSQRATAPSTGGELRDV